MSFFFPMGKPALHNPGDNFWFVSVDLCCLPAVSSKCTDCIYSLCYSAPRDCSYTQKRHSAGVLKWRGGGHSLHCVHPCRRVPTCTDSHQHVHSDAYSKLQANPRPVGRIWHTEYLIYIYLSLSLSHTPHTQIFVQISILTFLSISQLKVPESMLHLARQMRC